jgi:3' terminal RNA ribose 2'-O-methyltransferase Hen1
MAGRNGEGATGPLATYVNDRPYVTSSFLSVAISKVLGSALGGRTTMRPDLVAASLPISVTFGPVRARGGQAVIVRLFRPLGYDVAAEALDEDGTRGCWMVTLSAMVRLQDMLSHLYVLAPVLDDRKHYWLAEDEIEKLLRHGEGWLAAHPDRELITRRYLQRGPGMARTALARLAELDEAPTAAEPEAAEPPEVTPQKLHDQRHEIVARAIRDSGATTVLDLGCGEGRLLVLLLRIPGVTKIVGTDISLQTLEIARDRLNLGRMAERQRERLTLPQSALTYRDRRLAGFDAAALVEVIEHIDPLRLPAFEQAVFRHARPKTVVLTTPNRDWNATIPALADGQFRHRDHRFEWTRAEFADWISHVAESFGYSVELSGIGDAHEIQGAPTQMAIFRCA